MATGRIFDGPISIRLSGPSRHQSTNPGKLIFFVHWSSCLWPALAHEKYGPKMCVFFKVHPILFSDEIKIALSPAIGTARHFLKSISRQPLRVSGSKQFRPLHAPALHQVHKWVVSQTDPRDSWMTEQQLGPSLDHVTAFVFFCVEKNDIQTLLSNSHSKRIWVKKLTFSWKASDITPSPLYHAISLLSPQGSWIAGRELKGNHSCCHAIGVTQYQTLLDFNQIMFTMIFKKRDSTKSPPHFVKGRLPIQSSSSGSTSMAPRDTHHGKNAGGPLGMVPLIINPIYTFFWLVFLGFPNSPWTPNVGGISRLARSQWTSSMLRVRRIPLVAWLNFLGHQPGGTPRYTNLQVCFVATPEKTWILYWDCNISKKNWCIYKKTTSKIYSCSLPEPGSQHPTILVWRNVFITYTSSQWNAFISATHPKQLLFQNLCHDILQDLFVHLHPVESVCRMSVDYTDYILGNKTNESIIMESLVWSSLSPSSSSWWSSLSSTSQTLKHRFFSQKERKL